MKKYKIGYTQGVYDMFHVGHLNLINNAKELCDFLVVGVNSDNLVREYKHKETIVSEKNRALIVSNIKAVDKCIIVSTLNKLDILNEVDYDVVFIGDDWKGNERWNKTEKELSRIGKGVIYLPHTNGISSTKLSVIHNEAIDEN